MHGPYIARPYRLAWRHRPVRRQRRRGELSDDRATRTEAHRGPRAVATTNGLGMLLVVPREAANPTSSPALKRADRRPPGTSRAMRARPQRSVLTWANESCANTMY